MNCKLNVSTNSTKQCCWSVAGGQWSVHYGKISTDYSSLTTHCLQNAPPHKTTQRGAFGLHYGAGIRSGLASTIFQSSPDCSSVRVTSVVVPPSGVSDHTTWGRPPDIRTSDSSVVTIPSLDRASHLCSSSSPLYLLARSPPR